MKVLLVNGSPHKNGSTYTALNEVSMSLNIEGIETEIYWLGLNPISDCIVCDKCSTRKECVFNDVVNDFRAKAAQNDGFIFGSPVHFGGISGTMKSFLDRLFYSETRGGNNTFTLKPASAVVSSRRAGTTAALDQVNKYIAYQQMPIISSQYWNMVHGNTPEEVAQDLEGLQIMRTLGKNMAFFLKCKQIALQSGLLLPTSELVVRTNFIR